MDYMGKYEIEMDSAWEWETCADLCTDPVPDYLASELEDLYQVFHKQMTATLYDENLSEDKEIRRYYRQEFESLFYASKSDMMKTFKDIWIARRLGFVFNKQSLQHNILSLLNTTWRTRFLHRGETLFEKDFDLRFGVRIAVTLDQFRDTIMMMLIQLEMYGFYQLGSKFKMGEYENMLRGKMNQSSQK